MGAPATSAWLCVCHYAAGEMVTWFYHTWGAKTKLNEEVKHLNGGLYETCWVPGARVCVAEWEIHPEYGNDTGGIDTWWK